MIPAYPYFPTFNYKRNNYKSPYNSKNIITHFPPNAYSPNNTFSKCNIQSCENNKTVEEECESNNYNQFFEIFGIKLFFDDLLILALLLFLYKEEVNDIYLYIVLFMLLLS